MADFSSIPASSGQQQEAPCAHFACHFVWMRKKGERDKTWKEYKRERKEKGTAVFCVLGKNQGR